MTALLNFQLLLWNDHSELTLKNALTAMQNNTLKSWLVYFRRTERNSAASTVFSKLSDRISERQHF